MATRHAAPAGAALAPHLEQVGEIAVEQPCQVEIRRIFAVILHADPLIRRTTPQKDRANDVQHVLAQHQPSLTIDVRVRQVDRQRGIVVSQV